MSQLAGTVPNTPGDVRMLLVVGVGGGIFTGSGFGGEVRVEGQVTEWAAVGGGLGAGYNRDSTAESRKHHQPQWIYGARGWGRFNPGAVDWVAMTAGTGIAGTNEGTVALTFDGAAMFGGAIDLNAAPPGQTFRLLPYGGPAAAISIPLRQGNQIENAKFWLGLGPDARSGTTYESVDYTTTYFLGMQGGIAADSGRIPAWTGGLELSLLLAFSGQQNATLLSLATGQGARIRR